MLDNPHARTNIVESIGKRPVNPKAIMLKIDIRKVVFTGLMVAATVGSPAQAVDSINLDFIEGRLKGTNIFSLSIDKLTDLIGRPSSVISPKIVGARGQEPKPENRIGTMIVYAHLGLLFAFEHPDNSAGEPLKTVKIFLAEQTDFQTKASFSAFAGTLNKGMSVEWKSKRILEEFAEFKPIDVANDVEMRKEVNKILGKLDSDVTPSFAATLKKITEQGMAQIKIKRPDFDALIQYEPNTKYLEWVVLSKTTAPPEAK